MEGSVQNGRVNREATYGERPELGLFQSIARQRIAPEKRVLRAAARTWENNLQHLVDAQNGFGNRAIASFLRRMPPASQTEIHRHNFEAIAYVIKGSGYEIHDGERIDWAEGDVVFVPANVWHQHFNPDPENEAIILFITNWPLLLGLDICTFEPAKSWEDALSRPSAIPEPRLAK